VITRGLSPKSVVLVDASTMMTSSSSVIITSSARKGGDGGSCCAGNGTLNGGLNGGLNGLLRLEAELWGLVTVGGRRKFTMGRSSTFQTYRAMARTLPLPSLHLRCCCQLRDACLFHAKKRFQCSSLLIGREAC
jgi:hypothetical protein